MNKKGKFTHIGIPSFLLIFLELFTVLGFYVGSINDVHAVGTWHGMDTYHTPMSWCAVRGSPAVDSPNVPNPPNPNDIDTDSILWRRHERPTDQIWLPQAGITMRSAIDDAWTSLDFPKITDPDQPDITHTNRGVIGDVLDPSIDPNQMNRMINVCRNEYSNIGRSGVGITIVNVNVMHDNNGKYNFAAGFGRFSTTAGGIYIGDIAVIDNHYLYPGITPRTLPGPSINPAWDRFTLTDPFDQLVGHELGHALGLAGSFDAYSNSHRNDDNHKLMYCCLSMQDANTPLNGQVDNFGLDDTAARPEITTTRSTATTVPSVERDPVGKVLSGDVVETIKVDDINEKNYSIPSYIDLSALRVIFNTKENKIYFGQELMGIIPNQTKNLQYWTLVNTDNNTDTGGDQKVLKALGTPLANFSGTDLVLKTEVEENNSRGTIWKYEKGNMALLPLDTFKPELVRMDGIVDYAVPDNAKAFSTKQFPMNHIVSVMVDNKYSQISLSKPFSIQTISIDKTLVTEPTNNNSDIFQSEFTVDRISFPHCFPRSNATAGQNVTIDLDGLTPNSGIHGLIGPTTVFHGQTDINGNATIQFPIPANATAGLHLITIGVDNTALTADCEVNVLKSGKSDTKQK